MKDYSYLLDAPIVCRCGRTHYVPIRIIDFGFKSEDITGICEKLIGRNNILVISDKHTYEQQTKAILNALAESDFSFSSLMFEPEGKLIPDEYAVGRITMSMTRDIKGIISIGSGTINDLARFTGSIAHIPVISVATAPSMDGYAASGSSLLAEGSKKTLKGVPVTAILGNLNVIREAPFEMIQSGFGDIIGKKTALADWILAAVIKGEYWCDEIARLNDNAADICIENAVSIAIRDKEAIGHLISALTLSGITMSMADDTRPASGTEHKISHYLVMKAAREGREIPSHGITVALGTLLASMLYEYLLKTSEFEQLENSMLLKEKLMLYLPGVEEVKKWLTAVGLPVHPLGYGMDNDLLEETLMNSDDIRDRYTVLTCLKSLKLSDRAIEHVLETFLRA